MLPQASAEEEGALETAAQKEPNAERASRVDWAELHQMWRLAPGAGVPDGPQRCALDIGAPGPCLAAAEAGPGTGAPAALLVLNSQPLAPKFPEPDRVDVRARTTAT